MFGDDVLTQLQAAVALPVPEVPQLQDPKTTDALKEQADWLRRLRDDIRQMIDPGIDKQPDDGLMNRLGALEGRVSALSLAPRMPPPVTAVLDPVEETLVVRLQAAIASGAAGNVKRCYWKSATSEWIEYGSAFSAHNAGPKDAPDDGVVLMVPRYTSASLPVFQYGTGADVANTASVIDDRTASAGTAATAMRSDGWPGLKLVGNPADGTAHTVGGNREATLEMTAAGATRYGAQVRLASADSPTDYRRMEVVTGGVTVKVSAVAGNKLTTNNGLYVPDSAPAGFIGMYGAAAAPSGWLLCDGSAVSRETYAALFAVISTTFGVGDGSTTFNVPDMRGRAPYGAGTACALAANDGIAEANRKVFNKHAAGSNTGNESAHTHPIPEMNTGESIETEAPDPADYGLLWDAAAYQHYHTIPAATYSTDAGTSHNHSNTPTHESQGHLGVTFIIKT